jgi:hypothetical protein
LNIKTFLGAEIVKFVVDVMCIDNIAL